MVSAVEISESLLTSVLPLISDDEDVVVIHSDLFRLGFNRCEEYGEGLTLFLQSLINRGKTIVLPSFTFSFSKTKMFNIESSPFETGGLAWLAKTQLGFIRTQNPMFSFCVKGSKSEAYLKSRWNSGYGTGSAVELLSGKDTCIIMLGCSWSYCTLIHNVEEKQAVPYREYIEWNYPMDFGTYKITEQPFRLYVRKTLPKTKLDFSRIRPELQHSNLLRESTINGKRIESANGYKISKIAEQKLKTDPYFFVDIINE